MTDDQAAPGGDDDDDDDDDPDPRSRHLMLGLIAGLIAALALWGALRQGQGR